MEPKHSAAALMNAPPPVFQNVNDLIRYAAGFVKAQQWPQLATVIHANAHLAHSSHYAQHLLGLAALGQSDFATASGYFAAALKLDPNYVDAAYYLGWAQMELGDSGSALHYLNHAIKLKPDHADAVAKVALILRDMNRADLALQWYQKLEVINPNYPALPNLMAIVYDALGDDEKADAYYEKAYLSNPQNIAFVFNMIYRKKHSLDSNLFQQATALYEHHKGQVTPDAAYACYTLATVYDQNKQFNTAFDYYQQANQIQSKLVPCLIEQEIPWTQHILDTYNESFVASQTFGASGFQDDTPIFVLGMPRSGTSLCEQILACHPKVSGAGELGLMRQITTTELNRISALPYPEGIPSLAPSHIQQLGQRYVQQLKTYSEATHIVDKMPHNFFHIGLIRQMLPNATIIHCVRDPVDTCWSIWRQIFYGRHTYKYDFDSLARAYGNYQSMMAHWHRLFPDAVYDFCYEDLLANPEPTIRTLLDHCGLEWDDNCLNFHETKRHVLTASTQQVRKPLYKSAVKSWEPLHEQLTPLIRALKHYDAIPKRYWADYQAY